MLSFSFASAIITAGLLLSQFSAIDSHHNKPTGSVSDFCTFDSRRLARRQQKDGSEQPKEFSADGIILYQPPAEVKEDLEQVWAHKLQEDPRCMEFKNFIFDQIIRNQGSLRKGRKKEFLIFV